jgi:hypothetical protein
MKKEWAHKYRDWLDVALARAELEALKLGTKDKAFATSEGVLMPDNIYYQARAMLSSQFSHKHPMVLDVMISRLRWAMSRLVSRPGGVLAAEATGYLSECRDCLYQIALIRAWDENASQRRLLELDVLELRILAIVWDLPELQSLLEQKDRIAILQRVTELGRQFEKASGGD